MKKLSVIFVGVTALIIGVGLFLPQNTSANARRGPTEELIRLHVRANSSSDEDMRLKLKVRDKVVSELDLILDGCNDREAARQLIMESLVDITELAEQVVCDEGYSYRVSVSFGKEMFPIRQYGELVMPAGLYEALTIDIGAGSGENFWCILYPYRCHTLDSAAVVSREDGRELRRSLTTEEYDKLFVKRSVPKSKVRVSFKLFELLKDVF